MKKKISTKKEVEQQFLFYQKLNKGLKKRNDLLKITGTALMTLPMFPVAVFSQCVGNDPAVTYDLATAAPLNVDLDGDGNDDVRFVYTNGYIKFFNLGLDAIGTTNGGVAFGASNGVTMETNSSTVFSTSGTAAATYQTYQGTGSSFYLNSSFSGGRSLIFKENGNIGFAQLTTSGSMLTIGQYGTDSNGGVTVAGDCSSMGAALPVEMTHFTAKAQTNQIALQWATASETNNAGFEIQRSMDGKTFENLTFREGEGNTQERQEYGYEDKGLRKGQLYYYRLKQLDFDGGFAFSEVVSARTVAEELTATFSPNPTASGRTALTYSTMENGAVSVRIFNVAGQELWQQTQAVEEGSNRFELDLSSLGSGLFFVKMKQGAKTAYEKVMIE